MRYLFLLCLVACGSNGSPAQMQEPNDAGKDAPVEAALLNPETICCYQTTSTTPDPMYQNKVWSCADSPTFFVCDPTIDTLHCDNPPCSAYDCTQCQFGWVCQTINGTGIIKACPK